MVLYCLHSIPTTYHLNIPILSLSPQSANSLSSLNQNSSSTTHLPHFYSHVQIDLLADFDPDYDPIRINLYLLYLYAEILPRLTPRPFSVVLCPSSPAG